jgi:hypothetical protein
MKPQHELCKQNIKLINFKLGGLKLHSFDGRKGKEDKSVTIAFSCVNCENRTLQAHKSMYVEKEFGMTTNKNSTKLQHNI